ncbi:hypothetical protein scyTo_0016266 [Scyliorhinus torazame]|uniref:Uncharacterized protein n=1 Tax=Scyliorhinus torazame TaxID=75743 RepID=A0A401Q5C5_SCYTO|nr:hypothetical protein [Scyliorhinus torazame]
MFLTQSIACYLLPFLLFQPSFGLVLSRGKRQANIPPDSDYAGLRLRFADDGDYQDQAGYSESVSEQRGARGFLIPNFRKPLDRIFSEKRTIPRANQVPR